MKRGFFDTDARRGVAALTFVILVGALTLAIASGITYTVTRQVRRVRLSANSVNAYAAAEAGVEEVLLRIQQGEAVPSPLTLSVGGGTATITYTTMGETYDITSAGTVDGVTRTVSVTQVRDNVDDVVFDFGVQIGDGGITFGNNAKIIGDIHSNGDIVGAMGVVTGDASVGAGLPASTDAEWTFNNLDYPFATASSNRDVAQSFTPGAPGALTQISILLGKTGSPGDITVRISPDDSGEPNNTTLASEVLMEVLVGAVPSWIDIGFTAPATVTAGVTYWIVLDTSSNSMTDFWNWRQDSSDDYAGYTGLYDNNWSSGNPNWSATEGDFAFQTWIGGGLTKMQDITVGDPMTGEAHAQEFVNVTVHGADCLMNMWCFVESPARRPLPISDGAIADWKSDATAGGTCVPPVCDAMGNLHVIGTLSLGPIVVNGNLTFENLATLNITGTIYIKGDILTSNNSKIRLDPAYQDLSGILMTDGQINVDNNSEFFGSGQPSSFIILLTDKTDHVGDVMIIDNRSVGVIYYAQDGNVLLKQTATATELTAYGVTMENNAIITYDPLLQVSQFSPGPQGVYTITKWEEIAP